MPKFKVVRGGLLQKSNFYDGYKFSTAYASCSLPAPELYITVEHRSENDPATKVTTEIVFDFREYGITDFRRDVFYPLLGNRDRTDPAKGGELRKFHRFKDNRTSTMRRAPLSLTELFMLLKKGVDHRNAYFRNQHLTPSAISEEWHGDISELLESVEREVGPEYTESPEVRRTLFRKLVDNDIRIFEAANYFLEEMGLGNTDFALAVTDGDPAAEQVRDCLLPNIGQMTLRRNIITGVDGKGPNGIDIRFMYEGGVCRLNCDSVYEYLGKFYFMHSQIEVSRPSLDTMKITDFEYSMPKKLSSFELRTFMNKTLFYLRIKEEDAFEVINAFKNQDPPPTRIDNGWAQMGYLNHIKRPANRTDYLYDRDDAQNEVVFFCSLDAEIVIVQNYEDQGPVFDLMAHRSGFYRFVTEVEKYDISETDFLELMHTQGARLSDFIRLKSDE